MIAQSQNSSRFINFHLSLH